MSQLLGFLVPRFLIGALAGLLIGSRALRSAGHATLAAAMLLVLAIPGVLAALFLLIALIAQPRWN